MTLISLQWILYVYKNQRQRNTVCDYRLTFIIARNPGLFTPTEVPRQIELPISRRISNRARAYLFHEIAKFAVLFEHTDRARNR